METIKDLKQVVELIPPLQLATLTAAALVLALMVGHRILVWIIRKGPVLKRLCKDLAAVIADLLRLTKKDNAD